jgi:hypothetical protein
MDNPVQVVLVGHCSMDQWSLRRAVGAALPDAGVTHAHQRDALAGLPGRSTLLLINRVLDGRFGVRSGIELIRELATGEDPPAMLLISNHADAQADAQAAGARPGFGKRDLGSDLAAQRLRDAAVRG